MRDPSDGRLMRDPTAIDDPGMAEHESSQGYLGRLIRESWRGLPFSVLLFVFWIVLSGKLDRKPPARRRHHAPLPFRCGPADFSGCRRRSASSASHPLAGVFWLRFPMYLLWLASAGHHERIYTWPGSCCIRGCRSSRVFSEAGQTSTAYIRPPRAREFHHV